MRVIPILAWIATLLLICTVEATTKPTPTSVPDEVMQQTYEEIKTPYKYGLIMIPDEGKMYDCPSVFNEGGEWYMTYIVFDGRGYETWLAKSEDLIAWETIGKIMSFSEGTWDANQKAGYIALQDHTWGGSYHWERYNEKYWMSYIGGDTRGYEAGALGVGIAWSSQIVPPIEWEHVDRAVLSPNDQDVRWWENHIIYKSTVIHDQNKTLGYPFVMYYNAKSLIRPNNRGIERIGMAVSEDMLHWIRYGEEPVIDHQIGISGDAQIAKIGELWVMFYFGAGWLPGGFDRFACSYDLVNWTRWQGQSLIEPSEDFDAQYAHKPYVIKANGVVYHYYNAVDKENNRGIALATSVPLGKSKKTFANP